jgi:hypothetical protein
MQQRWYRMWPVLLVIGAIFAVLTVAPMAVGATDVNVSTGAGPDGKTALMLAGNGFGPGEGITITGYTNNGGLAQFPSTTANAIGAFQATLFFQPNVLRIQATGQLTGLTALTDVGPAWVQPPGFVPIYPQVIPCPYYGGGYYWGSCAPAYVNPYVPPTTTAPPATPAGNTAKVGQAVSIPAAGFSAGETVLVTLTGPNGMATAGTSTQADANGNATVTVTFPSAGNWTVTIKGQTSGKQGTIQYSVSA